MPRYFEITEREVDELFEALRYVVGKEGEIIDLPMVEYLTEIVDRISDHVHNENRATPGTIIAEIDMIQEVLGRVKDE
jgi:hypothetical protein